VLYASVSKEDCLAFFTGQLATDRLDVRDASSAVELSSENRGAVLIWNSTLLNAKGWPDAISLSQSFKFDFLAWAHTYLASHSPIGAFLHVLDDDCVPIFLREHVNSLAKVDCLVALPATESLTNIDAREDAITLPSVLLRSCSFAALKAMAIGYQWKDVAKVIENWGSVRELFSLPESRIDVPTMKLVFAVAHVVNGDKTVEPHIPRVGSIALNMVMEYAATGSISELSWRTMTDRLNDTPLQALLSQGPREARVPLVQRLLKGAYDAPDRESVSTACFVGYVVNQLAPGTLEHTNLLRPLSGVFPSTLLWYGLFAGLHKNGGLKGYFSTPTAAILRREFNRPTFIAGPPTCDITADELFMIYAAKKNPPRLRGLIPNQIAVSILPGVDVPIRVAPKEKEQLDSSVSSERRSIDLRLNNLATLANSLRQQNLWANFGSGSAPSL
jgi:hypothetical protein